MKNRGSHAVYNKKKASSYDNQRARLAPLKDALYLCTRMILSELPVDAQVLPVFECMFHQTDFNLIIV